MNPHENCKLHYAGATLNDAEFVVLAVHGRYGVAADILKFVDKIDAKNAAWVAPQAADQSWLSKTFLAPLSDNEAHLTSALDSLAAILKDLFERGFGPEKIVLVGFSQGACLILEYVARFPKQWRGVVAMSGGLIGTAESGDPPRTTLNDHAPKRFQYSGRLADVPIHLGCHEGDPLIPIERVRTTKRVLDEMGAKVTLAVEIGNMHGVLPSDIQAIKDLL